MVKEGYEVVTALDGREALEMFEAERPDIFDFGLNVAWNGRFRGGANDSENE